MIFVLVFQISELSGIPVENVDFAKVRVDVLFVFGVGCVWYRTV